MLPAFNDRRRLTLRRRVADFFRHAEIPLRSEPGGLPT